MGKDTGESIFSRFLGELRKRKKAASARGLWKLFHALGVVKATVVKLLSQNYRRKTILAGWWLVAWPQPARESLAAKPAA